MTDTTELSTLFWTSLASESPGKYSRAPQLKDEGWHILDSPRRPPCAEDFKSTLLSQGMDQPEAISSHCPHLDCPWYVSSVNRNKTIFVHLSLFPIRVWKFYCGFPSGFLSVLWASEMIQMKLLAAWKMHQPWPWLIFPSLCFMG